MMRPTSPGLSSDLHATLAEYRAGLDAELSLLRQLDSLSARQRLIAGSSDTTIDTTGAASNTAALRDIHAARESVMRSLVEVEHELVPLRRTLAEARHELAGNAEFQAVAALHKDAAAMVTRIIASDEECKRALEQAELARRSAATAMEKGETTLQAYRRVITPTANASLLNRRG